MTTHYDLEDGNINHLKSRISHNSTKSQASYSNYQYNYRPGQWIRYNSINNPCPVCSGDRRDCRSKDGLYYCRGENPSKDFKYRGDDSIGFSMYVSLSDSLPQPQQRDNYSNNYHNYQQKSPISDTDRAIEFQKAVKQLGLSTPHKMAIERRGLSPDLIEKYQFKSIDGAIELINSVKPGMPLRYGKKFAVRDNSILIPVWQNHKIVGAQTRPDDTSQAKYLWLKADKASSHLESGELPLACIIPNEINQVGVGFCESVGFKPIISAERLGKVMIGAAGGNFVSSKKQLLNLLETHHPDKSTPVILYPDAGANENAQVLKGYDKLRAFLQHHGYSLKVSWWEQWDKETCLDIDDYLVRGGSDIKIIDWEQYDRYRRVAKSHYKKSRKYTPDITVNDRYISSDTISQYIKPRSIVAVKSPMGTGKTETLKSVISEHCQKRGLLMLGTRNSLLMQSCERLNIYHLRNDDAAIFMNDKYSMIANCVDSLPRWDDSNLENRIIVIDEVSSLIPHLLAGATCKRQRSFIIRKFEHALKHAYAIILLDANLKDTDVKYIANTSDFADVTKIVNIYSPPSWSVDYVRGSSGDRKALESDDNINANSRDYHSLISPIANNSNPIIIVSDSQKLLESLHHILGIDRKDILRIDSHTVTDCEQKEFIKNPDSYIGRKRPRVIMLSPTIDAGVSIDIKGYFTDMYGFRFHLGTDEFMQMLGRVRDSDCKRHIYSKEFIDKGNYGVNSPYERRVRNAQISDIKERIMANISNDEKLQHLAPHLRDVLSNSDDVHFDAYNNLVARRNYERQNLRETLREKLIEEGHKVNDIYLNTDEKMKAFLKNAKEKVISINAGKMFDAPDINLTEADSILSSWSASYEDRLKADKSVLINRVLPGVQYTRLWCKEFLELIQFKDILLTIRLKLRYGLQNLDKALTIEQHCLLKLATKDKFYIPDCRSPHFVASKMAEVGILNIINNPDREWTNDDEELNQIIRRANNWRRRNYFPRRGKQSNIRYVNQILQRVGYQLKECRRYQNRRFYQLVDIYESFQVGEEVFPLASVLTGIIAKKIDSRVERAETYIDKSLKFLPEPLNNIYKQGVVAENSQARSPDIRAGDLVDVDDGRIYCSVVEVQKEKVIANWGTKGIFEFNLDQILRVRRKLDDDWPEVWAK